MSLSSTQHYFTKLYLAAFLRAPDLGGLNYWTDEVLVHGKSFQSVGGIIFSLPVVTDIYPASLSDLDFVEAIYHNVFGRDSDAEGLNYWTNEVAALRSAYAAQGSANADFEARGQLVMNMMNAGLGTPDGTDGKAYIENRLAVAEYVAEQQLEQGRDISVAFLLETLSHVNADTASVTDAKNALENLLTDTTAPNLLSIDVTTSSLLSGKITTELSAGSENFTSLIQLDDGKLAIAGQSNGKFALVRLNADATLDANFGDNGSVTADFGTSDQRVNSLVQQTDGKLVLAGSAYTGVNDDFAIARFNADGTLDTSFGSAGKVTTGFAGGRGDIGNSLIQQSDGKLLVAGYEYSSYTDYSSDLFLTYTTYHGFSLARYNSDGSLDTSFGTNGTLNTTFAGNGGAGYNLIQQSDDKLIVAGSSNKDFALARYNLDGTLDSGFGTNGLVTTDFAGNYDIGSSLIQQTDGKLLLAGSSNGDFALVRYNLDGSLDTSFGGDGKVTTDFAGSYDQGYNLIQQTDGKLLLAGVSGTGNTNSNYNFALARYNDDGSLDLSFGGGDGKVTTDFSNNEDIGYNLIQQADGKLLLSGTALALNDTGNGLGREFALARYNVDGTLDTSFGGERLSALALSSDEAATAGLYNGNFLVGSSISLSANVAAHLDVNAQASVTQTTLRLTDDAGNSSSGPAVALGTTGSDYLSLSSSGYLFGFDGNDTLTGSSGADVFVGGGGSDTLELGNDSAIDRVMFETNGSSYDIIHGMDLGTGGDVLDFMALNLGNLNLSTNALYINPSQSIDISGHVVRLLDVSGGQNIAYHYGSNELLSALNDGEYANLDMSANSTALVITASIERNFFFRVDSTDTGAIGSVALIGVINNVNIDNWTADNFAF